MARIPQNDFTQMIADVARLNASGARSGPVSAGAAPTVRSAALGTMAPDPPPLTAEEQAHLDAKARAIGILSPDPTSEGPYGTLEEAMTAGAPMNPPVQAQAATPVQAQRSIHPVGPTRLPNFKHVQGIDLIRNVIYIDGMEFPIPEGDVRFLRAYAIDHTRNYITKMLNDAMNAVNPPVEVEKTDGPTCAVSDVQEGEGAQRVQEVGTLGRTPEAPVPTVPDTVSVEAAGNTGDGSEQG